MDPIKQNGHPLNHPFLSFPHHKWNIAGGQNEIKVHFEIVALRASDTANSCRISSIYIVEFLKQQLHRSSAESEKQLVDLCNTKPVIQTMSFTCTLFSSIKICILFLLQY